MLATPSKKPSQYLASQLSKQHRLTLAAFACALTVIVYGRMVWLPFFFDDLVQLPFVDRYTMAEHWVGSNESPYYRPLVISIWKILSWLTGTHSALAHHGINLSLHALNGFLLALLSIRISHFNSPFSATKINRISPTLLFGLVVTTLYLLFPFHHQVVPWPGALFHIVVTTLILGSILAYLNEKLVIACLLALLAPFAHENGVVIPALIFALELYRFNRAQWQTLFVRPVLMAIPAVLWLVIRSFVLTARDSQSLFPGFESIGQSLTWFLQGLTWPGTIFGRYLLDQLPLNDLSIIWLMGSFSILISILICFRSRADIRLPLFGAIWWGVTSAPAMLILPFGYIVNSPRLLSLAGCGVAIFWGSIIYQLAKGIISQPVKRQLFSILAIGIFMVAQFFALLQIREANQFHLQLGGVYQQAAEIASELDQSKKFPVFINFPSSTAPLQKTFILGNEGVVFWPGYAPQHTIVTTNGQIQKIDQQFLQVDRIRTDQPYLYGIVRPTTTFDKLQQDTAAVYYNTVYTPDSIDLTQVGAFAQQPVTDPIGTFTQGSGGLEVTLSEWEVTQKRIGNDKSYQIKMNWSLADDSNSAENITVFLHAISTTGELVDQNDGDPIADLLPLSMAPSDGIVDYRFIPMNPSISHFRLGLYNRVTGERVPFYDTLGNRMADDMFIAPITNTE